MPISCDYYTAGCCSLKPLWHAEWHAELHVTKLHNGMSGATEEQQWAINDNVTWPRASRGTKQRASAQQHPANLQYAATRHALQTAQNRLSKADMGSSHEQAVEQSGKIPHCPMQCCSLSNSTANTACEHCLSALLTIFCTRPHLAASAAQPPCPAH